MTTYSGLVVESLVGWFIFAGFALTFNGTLRGSE